MKVCIEEKRDGEGKATKRDMGWERRKDIGEEERETET
jgi:hypothetical protein